MKRGDVVTIADRDQDYAGKPRPAVVVHSDHFGSLESVTVCPITSSLVEAVFRVAILPGDGLPLRRPSRIAVDKITTVRREKVGKTIGTLAEADVQRLNSSLLIFLGIG